MAYEEALEPYAGARVLARFADGRAAIVENKYGKGTAILIGSFAALGYHDHSDKGTQALFLAIAQAAGVDREVQVTATEAERISVRRLIGANEQVVFIFNSSDKENDVELVMRSAQHLDQVTDWVNSAPVEWRQEENRVVLSRSLAPHEVWVLGLRAH
jgi:hypothetical protein